MATLYVTSAEDPISSTGNAGTFADPMGLQEAFDAAASGDEIRVMDNGTYDVDTTSLVPPATGSSSGFVSIFGANSSGVVDGSKPSITTSTGGNTILFNGGNAGFMHFRYLDLYAQNRAIFNDFQNTLIEDVDGAGNGSSSRFIQDYGSGCLVRRCSYTPLSPSAFVSRGFSQSITIVDCVATGCSTFIAPSSNGRGSVHLIRCVSIDSTSFGFDVAMGASDGVSLVDCVSIGSGASGFQLNIDGAGHQCVLSRCISIDSTDDGFRIDSGSSAGGVAFDSCVAIASGGYGFNNLSISHPGRSLMNCYGQNNTSGLQSSGFDGTVLSLATDPFVDSANLDLTLAGNAGGDALRDLAVSVGNGESSDLYPFRSLVGTLGGGGTRAHFG